MRIAVSADERTGVAEAWFAAEPSAEEDDAANIAHLEEIA